MIIDAHNHLGHRHDIGISTEDFLKRMDRAAVDMAVCFPPPVIWDNEYVYQATKQHPDRIIQFVGINPWKETAKDELRKYLDLGAKGLKLHPVRDSYSLADKVMVNPLFEICQEYKVPILAHGKDEWSNTPWHFHAMAQRFPEVTLILAHCGHNWLRDDAIEVAKQNENIWIESSIMYTDYVRKVIEEVSPLRMIMGTDAPAEVFETELVKIDMATSDPEIRALVKGHNIARLLGIAH